MSEKSKLPWSDDPVIRAEIVSNFEKILAETDVEKRCLFALGLIANESAKSRPIDVVKYMGMLAMYAMYADEWRIPEKLMASVENGESA